MESRPLLTPFQIGGSAGDALPDSETRRDRASRSIALYSRLFQYYRAAGDVLKSAAPLHKDFA
jgi:hypothetical protein